MNSSFEINDQFRDLPVFRNGLRSFQITENVYTILKLLVLRQKNSDCKIILSAMCSVSSAYFAKILLFWKNCVSDAPLFRVLIPPIYRNYEGCDIIQFWRSAEPTYTRHKVSARRK